MCVSRTQQTTRRAMVSVSSVTTLISQAGYPDADGDVKPSDPHKDFGSANLATLTGPDN